MMNTTFYKWDSSTLHFVAEARLLLICKWWDCLEAPQSQAAPRATAVSSGHLQMGDEDTEYNDMTQALQFWRRDPQWWRISLGWRFLSRSRRRFSDPASSGPGDQQYDDTDAPRQRGLLGHLYHWQPQLQLLRQRAVLHLQLCGQVRGHLAAHHQQVSPLSDSAGHHGNVKVCTAGPEGEVKKCRLHADNECVRNKAVCIDMLGIKESTCFF